jgi:hypothetical protein
MQTTTTDLGKSFQRWKIMQELQRTQGGTGIGDMITAGCSDPLRWDTLIETLRDLGLDDERQMIKAIGEKAWGMILKYQG